MLKLTINVLLFIAATALITEQYPDYVADGESFLDQTTSSFNQVFYDITALFSIELWDGFLSGLYEESNLDMKETCLTSHNVLVSVVMLTEATTKENFFMNVAVLIREITKFVVDIRKNCRVDMLVGDMIKFCSTEC